MHIKSNIELNVIHFAVLAICPLILVVTGSMQALFFLVMVAIGLVLSLLVCTLLNKYLSVPIKIFLTALISTLLVTAVNFLLGDKQVLGVGASNINFYVVLSTIILSSDTYYVHTKASTTHYIKKILVAIISFSLLLMIYTMVVEILGYGTFFGMKIKNFAGIEFFRGITFSLLWLGLICALAELIFRTINTKLKNRTLTYQKFLKQIRNERAFQYDQLRREKLLTNPIEVNSIGGEKADEESEKSNDNIVDVEEKPEEPQEEPKSTERKKRKHFKASKETKVEKVYDDEHREDK